MKECKNLTSEVKSQRAVYYVMWKQTCGTCKGEAVWGVYRHVSALLAVSVVVAVADSKLSLLGRAELKKIARPPSLLGALGRSTLVLVDAKALDHAKTITPG